jgi:hypothetical protein
MTPLLPGPASGSADIPPHAPDDPDALTLVASGQGRLRGAVLSGHNVVAHNLQGAPRASCPSLPHRRLVRLMRLFDTTAQRSGSPHGNRGSSMCAPAVIEPASPGSLVIWSVAPPLILQSALLSFTFHLRPPRLLSLALASILSAIDGCCDSVDGTSHHHQKDNEKDNPRNPGHGSRPPPDGSPQELVRRLASYPLGATPKRVGALTRLAAAHPRNWRPTLLRGHASNTAENRAPNVLRMTREPRLARFPVQTTPPGPR